MTDTENNQTESPTEETEEKKEAETESSSASEKEETAQSENQNTSEADKLINIQAARYMQISNLESNVFNDDMITNDEVNRISFCKSQVLLELVRVEDYVSKMPADTPYKKAAEVLLKHLYKCYDKVDKMQNRAREQAQQTRYKKDVRHELLNTEAQLRRLNAGMAVDDSSLLPSANTINLQKMALPAGATSMLAQFINNPVASLKSQMPDLIEEMDNKLSETDKLNSEKIISTLIVGLARFKNEKQMANALEGTNLAGNILSIISGNSK